jgi:uncharacterized protein (DUF58 family)
MVVAGDRLPWLLAVLVPVAAVVAELGQDWRLGVGLIAILTVSLAGIDAFRAGSPALVDVARHAPASAVMGNAAEMRWTVSNRSKVSRRILVADEFAPSLGAQRRAVVELPPHGAAEVLIPFRPARRGLFSMSLVTVRIDGPWRLAGRQHERDLPAELRVVPVFRSKREIELRLHRARLLEVGVRSVMARGGGTEFDHLRDYSVDDSYRHIDWAATARTGHPIVRSYRAEQHQTVIVVLDNGRMMAAKSGGVTRIEHAIDAVMALATVSSRVGDRLGLLAFDSAPHRIVAPGRGRQHMSALTESMFALEPLLSESDYDRMATTVLARFRRRAMVVLLTDLVSPVVDASIASAVSALATRHQVLVGAVTNSDVVEWTQRVPADRAEAFQTGAALLSIDDRAVAASRLRSVGAKVIDVEAGRLGPQLVDEYLEAKARLR